MSIFKQNNNAGQEQNDSFVPDERNKRLEVNTQIDWEERYQRLAADFTNYKQRIAEERADLESRLQEKLLESFLVIYDDFLRLNHDSDRGSSLAAGVAAVQKKWQQWLEENDVRMLRPHGEEFDPNFHEAVLQQPVEDPELDGKITQVIENGYMHREKVIRHAKVAVGRYEGRTHIPVDVRI